MGAGWSFAWLDVVEGDRLWAECGRDAADEWAVRSVRRALRQGAVGAELSATGGGQRSVDAGCRTASGNGYGQRCDGWALAGIFSEASGRGYSYDIFGGTRLSGGHESINGSGGSVVLPTVGRNTLRLPDSGTSICGEPELCW